jgi:hypothetical protein
MGIESQRAIVLIHRGTSWYLKYTLQQLRLANPHSRLVLLGDQKQFLYARFAECYSIESFAYAAAELDRFYIHLSPNTPEYEKFCLARWFILLEFARRHHVESIVHFDSDVMVFSDVWIEMERFKHDDAAKTGFQGPNSLLINRISFLDDFCAYIVHMYQHHSDSLAKNYYEWLSNGSYGGISDMHFLHTFCALGSYRVADNNSRVHGSIFDDNIQSADGFKMENGLKKITYIQRIPHFHPADNSAVIKVNAIHFQGGSKIHILGHLHWFSPVRRLLTRIWTAFERRRWITLFRRNK